MENLRKLKRPQLIELAGRFKVKKRHRLRKRDLIKKLEKLVPEAELDRLVRQALRSDNGGRRALRAADSSSRERQEPPPPAPPQTFVDRGQPIPLTYGQDRIVALVRDPNCIFVYWELDGPRCDQLKGERGGDLFDGASWILRVYAEHDGYPRDVPIVPEAGNWYLSVPDDNRYHVELGIVTRRGDFVAVQGSNPVRTPRMGMSDNTSAEWMRVEDGFRKVERLNASEVPKAPSTFADHLAQRFAVPGMSSLFLGASGRVPGSAHMGSHTLQKRKDS